MDTEEGGSVPSWKTYPTFEDDVVCVGDKHVALP